MKVFFKFLSVLVIVLAPVVLAQSSAPAYQAKSAKLDRAQIDAWLAKPDQVLFIDLRRPDELTAIGGFGVYLSIQFEELEKSLAFIPKERHIITVSNSSGRSLRAADLLTEKGFKVIGAAGSKDYEAQGGKIIKIAPKAPATPK